jgi:hypothetical protein
MESGEAAMESGEPAMESGEEAMESCYSSNSSSEPDERRKSPSASMASRAELMKAARGDGERRRRADGGERRRERMEASRWNDRPDMKARRACVINTEGGVREPGTGGVEYEAQIAVN